MKERFQRRSYEVKAIKYTGKNKTDVINLFCNRYTSSIEMDDYLKLFFTNSSKGGSEDYIIVVEGNWIVEDYWKLNVMSEENFNKYYEVVE